VLCRRSPINAGHGNALEKRCPVAQAALDEIDRRSQSAPCREDALHFHSIIDGAFDETS
jgi:hypothetical protein